MLKDILHKKQTNTVVSEPLYDREVYETIFDDPGSSAGKKLTDFINICIIISVGVIMFETIPGLSRTWEELFFTADILVSLVFAAEYLYRWSLSSQKFQFVFRPFNIIDLLSFLPFFIGILFPAVAGYDALKVLRIFRVLRVFEISGRSPIVQ